MANWSDLKAAVVKVIKTNGNQEITGQILQDTLNSIISNVGKDCSFAGIATPTTNPGTPDGNVFYLASESGTYSNFNAIEIAVGEAVILEWRGSWKKKISGFATQEKFNLLDKNKGSYFITGNGNKYSSINFPAISGRTYCITLKNTKWLTDEGTTNSLFYIGKVVNGEEITLLSVTDFSSIRSKYVFTAENDVEVYRIGGRASVGTNIYLDIKDITNFGLLQNSISAYDVNSGLFGNLIPINEGGYVPYNGSDETIDVENVTFSTLFLHKVIPCKKGDCYFIKAKGGNFGELFVFCDNDYKVITYSGADIDYSEKGYLFCTYSDGYMIINANITAPIKVIKVDKNNKPKKIDATNYVYLTSGYIYYLDGTRRDSSVNNRTNYIPTLGYSSMRIPVNVTSSDADSGMAFYDENREFISGIMSLKGKEKGISVAELDFPKGTCYVASTIYKDNSDIFFMELFNRDESNNRKYTGGGIAWVDGNYADYLTGEIKTSSANSYGELNVKNCSIIDVTVNKSSLGVSAGICFYDENKNFIKGFPYPDFGNSSEGASYVNYTFSIPVRSTYCRFSFYTENKEHWEATVHTQVSSNYSSLLNLSELYGAYANGLSINAPFVYKSNKTAEAYTSLDSKKVSELYAIYDEMVSSHPSFIKKEDDLTTVAGFAIRNYTIGFQHRVLIDHEPQKDEIVSQNLWDNNDNPKTILITCGMHGNEKTACWGAALAFKELLESEEDWANYIKTNVVLKVIPCLNPYGFENNVRTSSAGYDLNRSGSENQPERLAYMEWIKSNRNAQLLIDVHGSQGRYAYVPIWAGQPFYQLVKRATTKIASSLYVSYVEFYNSIKSGYGSTYSPFILSKFVKEASRGNCSVEMLARFGMPEFALETPDNIIVEVDGEELPDHSGLIQFNDLRNCKITKDLIINMLGIFSSIPVLNKIIPEE